ncbi:DUF4381 family protein [Frateuria edaphi]|uniref:DUF4381 family protein n=1 Tax=Frateuria edaphi TaxID=2898793 RepID=UPI001E43AA49|nr:DUF4381 family protein [Frateuria edaphi]UGB46023.1 DUF4381 family protein [Frateuria edaphi]
MMHRLSAPGGPELRDIHLPPAPPWWPPAPGWWLLAALVLGLLGAGAWLLLRARKRRHRRARILAEVDALAIRHAADAQALAAGLHQLLRRVARTHDPAAARLRGEAWREALARVPVDAPTLERLLTLESAMYRPQPYDTRAMMEAVRCWLRAALAAQGRRVRRA